MRKYLAWGLVLLSCFFLSSCTNKYYTSQTQNDLVTETWPKSINTHPSRWTRNTDAWFLAGEPTRAEVANRNSPYSSAVSTMMVRVPNFSMVRVEGSFTVQLFSGVDHNSVFVYGPNAEVRNVAVEVREGTLCVYQIPGSGYLRHTIIRIGVNKLTGLVNIGPGLVEGRQLNSSALRVNLGGSGNILLSGHLRLRQLTSSGSGNITMLGVVSPAIDIKMYGTGDVNLSGRVGVQSIFHAGYGDLNIIGADSDGLSINACGSGTVAIVGRANLRQVEASNFVHVYLYWVRSQRLRVSTYDNACVGLAGFAGTLSVDTHGSSGFEGQYLYADTVYVKTMGKSHANVAANNKAFAFALDSSSIYFFGPSAILSKYLKDHGSVITIPRSSRSKRSCAAGFCGAG
ncbi:MAG: hypothetical protein A3E84_04845 [Gammaproteobacteria bacterium RIFCSPHIGHO2_12_FULL_42_13]|nr:MAG: hypothetical protein A3E84_04845 [Gammaproteobacteria bacterium RIFCSPHIGHO2_12_FULL_42_13]